MVSTANLHPYIEGSTQLDPALYTVIGRVLSKVRGCRLMTSA